MREKITSAVFVAVLLFFFMLIILPADEKAAEKEHLSELPEISMQSVLSGEFGTKYETYLSDNIAYRSHLIALGTKVEDIRGIQRKNTGKIIEPVGGSQLVLNNGKIMEVYQAKPEITASYIDTLNQYAEAFSDDANLYVMLVPTQIEFDQSEYHKLADSAKETIDHVYASLPQFKTVNVYDKLEQHIDEYIYFRTDHHWTQRGGYYGYQSIMEAMDEEPVALEAMAKNSYDGFLGYLFNQANEADYAQYADEIEYFQAGENYVIDIEGVENGEPFFYQKNIYTLPGEGGKITYSLFMDGDHPLTTIRTNHKNGKVALIIKDSYANTVIPLLTNHYETILVIDPRSFHKSVTELMEEYEIDDMIFINYVFTTTFQDFIDSIGNVK